MVYIQHNINYNSEEDKNGLKEVLNKLQGQGTDYETYRSVLSSESKSKFTSVLPSRDKRLRHSANVLKVREDCRISSNDELKLI